MNDLVRYEAMCVAIDDCHAVDEAFDIKNKAQALEAYARQTKNTDAERKAAGVRLRAERRTGELLKELARGDPGRPEKVPSVGTIANKPASPPSEAACAIGEVMGQTLLLAWSGETFTLSAMPIWVRDVAVALSLRGVA